MSKKLSISKAIGEALHEEMARDENVIIMGEDMGKMGNVFGITVGFQEEFGENRVFDTPISESGFCGMAVGAAMRGIRPVVELMYDDFITVAADPIINQAAKIGEQTKADIVTEAREEAARLTAKAQDEIAREKTEALNEIRNEIADLAVLAASKVVGKTIDVADHQNMVNNFVKEVGEAK